MITIGVIADTHVPDRARRLDARVLSIFQEADVSAILHAGDVSVPSVLAQLGEVAPVYAVRGNRDWVMLRHLPLAQTLNFEEVAIGLTHGHGRWWNYLIDRFYFLVNGYEHDRLQPRLLRTFPDARVIVFGHSHSPLNCWLGEQLLFNPGSAHFPEKKELAPSVGLLFILAGREVKGEIIRLI